MLIDAHTHLNMYQYMKFGSDLNSALHDIEENQILTLSNSLDITSFRRNKKIAETCSYVIPVFGIHPWNAHKYYEKLDSINKYMRGSPFIGEIGLDYYFIKDKRKYPAQRKVFEHFITGSEDNYLIVHSKGAEKDVSEILKDYGKKEVIIHWYQGDLNTLQEMIKEGYYFTVGLEINLSKKFVEITNTIPISQLLTETDNPGGPHWLTGVMGMPILLKEIVKGLAEVMNVTIENIESQIQSNFSNILRNTSYDLETY